MLKNNQLTYSTEVSIIIKLSNLSLYLHVNARREFYDKNSNYNFTPIYTENEESNNYCEPNSEPSVWYNLFQ